MCDTYTRILHLNQVAMVYLASKIVATSNCMIKFFADIIQEAGVTEAEWLAQKAVDSMLSEIDYVLKSATFT
jgi:hypothetical protein